MDDAIKNLKNPVIKKRLFAALIGLITIILSGIFELPVNETLLTQGINMLMVYLSGQTITDAVAIHKGTKLN